MIAKLFISVICFLPFFGVSLKAYESPSYVKIADDIMIKASKRLAEKHGLRFCGISGGMMGCVKLMGVTYQLNRLMEKNEARAVVVDCVQEILADINQDEPVRKYLQVYPFDANHLEVMILLSTPDMGTLYYPDLTVVNASKGKITYSTNDPNNKYQYKTRDSESFEDAVKIVESQNLPKMLPQ